MSPSPPSPLSRRRGGARILNLIMSKLINSPWEDVTDPVIIAIEDSDEDFYVFFRTIQKLGILERSAHNFLRFQDGDDFLDYLFRQGNYQELKAPLPVMILLDINLPSTDGREIIAHVKQSTAHQMIPIVVITTSNSPKDIDSCYRKGANTYMIKPIGTLEMQEKIQTLFHYWFSTAVLPSHV